MNGLSPSNLSHQQKLFICVKKQKLYVQQIRENSCRVIAQYDVNTAKNGVGEMKDSECTPRGRHCIVDKIGKGCFINTIFVGRQSTGQVYQKEKPHSSLPMNDNASKDFILTRILRLAGLEDGVNKGYHSSGQCVDSFARYIYIHGSPDEASFDQPNSKGCIRMRNADIIVLYDRVQIGNEVFISENLANDSVFS